MVFLYERGLRHVTRKYHRVETRLGIREDKLFQEQRIVEEKDNPTKVCQKRPQNFYQAQKPPPLLLK